MPPLCMRLGNWHKTIRHCLPLCCQEKDRNGLPSLLLYDKDVDAAPVESFRPPHKLIYDSASSGGEIASTENQIALTIGDTPESHR